MTPEKFHHDHKIAYNSSCIRDISEMLASNRGFSGTGEPMMSVKYMRSDPRCYGNKIWDKIGYNSVSVVKQQI